MKPILGAACLCGMLSGALWAQSAATPESLTAWPFYREIQSRAGPSEFLLDREVLAKARTDHADLRLYDSAGHEVPYSLGIRRDIDTHSLFAGREFNRVVEGSTSIVSCDLGADPQEHNEAVISTAGDNFRRFATVEGSPDGAQWSTLASQAILFRFSFDGRTAERSSVSYPESRYRYLRVRVEHDPQVDRAAPEITGLSVERAVRAKGVNVPFDVTMQGREADPYQGRPASIWRFDLGGHIPLQSLVLNIGEPAFSRPFQLEIVDDPGNPQPLASGYLTRTEERASAPVQIDFKEQFPTRLKLTVTDDRNPPLTISSVTALSAARQVVFDSPGAVRLYYGNPKAIAPNYYVVPRGPAGQANRIPLGPEQANPTHRPLAKPLSERSPWLVYVVLIAACAALAGILLKLAKASARTVIAQ
jgi:hypothetical protein